MWRDASHMDLPASKVDEKQHVVCHEPTQCPDLSGEKVGRDQHVQMCTDKLLPRGGRLALWGWHETMALEDIAHGLITDRVPEIGQGTHDPVIAPRTILVRHAYHQRLQLLVDLRSTQRLALLRAIKL